MQTSKAITNPINPMQQNLTFHSTKSYFIKTTNRIKYHQTSVNKIYPTTRTPNSHKNLHKTTPSQITKRTEKRRKRTRIRAKTTRIQIATNSYMQQSNLERNTCQCLWFMNGSMIFHTISRKTYVPICACPCPNCIFPNI